MSAEELQATMEADMEFYAAVALKIKTKDARLVPLIFNRPQQMMHEFAEKMLREVGYIRIVMLKARQEGGSTYIGARGHKKAATVPMTNGIVIAHTAVATKTLFRMQDRYHNSMPPVFKPMAKYVGKTELYFANPTKKAEEKEANPGLDSMLSVYSARAIGAGRGDTIRFLHCSELPQWPTNAKDVMLGLLNAVPKDGDAIKGTEVWLESTAKGVGDYFYDQYYAAKQKRGGTVFRALFIPWYLMDEYSSRVPHGFVPTAPERELMEKEHGDWEYVNPATGKKTLSLEQVVWRRDTIANECDNNVDLFRQEYPTTDDEAFLTSGKPFFPIDEVKDRLAYVIANVKPLFVGEIELPLEIGKDIYTAGRKLNKEPMKITANPYGSLTIWENPKEDHSYYIAADVAAGLIKGDRSVVKVRSRQSGNEVACWKGWIEPDVLAFVFYILGRHYNFAYGSPETNNHGLTTLVTLRDLCYPGIYMRLQNEKLTHEPTEMEGWITSARTRPLMLDEFKSDFREDGIQINDILTLQEMLTFVQADNGKFQAQDGCFDDHVMCEGILSMMKREMKANAPRKRSRIKPGGEGGSYRG